MHERKSAVKWYFMKIVQQSILSFFHLNATPRHTRIR